MRGAGFALPAFRRVQRNDVVALLQRGHARPDVNDDTRAFVAEHHREQPFRIAARAREFIGMTDAGRLDLDQHFAGLGTCEIQRDDFEWLTGFPADGCARFHSSFAPSRERPIVHRPRSSYHCAHGRTPCPPHRGARLHSRRGYLCPRATRFPPQAFTWLRDDLGLRAGKTAVESARARANSPACWPRPARWSALEPVPAMLERLISGFPEVAALRGPGPEPSVGGRTVRCDDCAQLFTGSPLARARGNSPGVAAPWPVRADLDLRDHSIDWVAKLDEILAPFEAMHRATITANGAACSRRGIGVAG